MDADKLSFLDDEHDDTEATEATEAPEEQEASGEEAEEASDHPEPVESKGEQDAAPPAESEEKQPGHVPLAALLDEREKRQKIEREAEELRRWRQQHEAKHQPKPDFYDNPEAALSQVQQATQQQMLSMKLQQSRFFAEREFGADLVNEAYAYFDQHPDQSHALVNEPSPFHAAVEFYKRQKAAAEIGSDPEAYKAKLRAELEAELASKAPPKPAAPPRSLASAPGAGGETHSPGSAFDQLFG
jgi:hypothetical protein